MAGCVCTLHLEPGSWVEMFYKSLWANIKSTFDIICHASDNNFVVHHILIKIFCAGWIVVDLCGFMFNSFGGKGYWQHLHQIIQGRNLNKQNNQNFQTSKIFWKKNYSILQTFLFKYFFAKEKKKHT